jgi:hypothetical protein
MLPDPSIINQMVGTRRSKGTPVVSHVENFSRPGSSGLGPLPASAKAG